MVFCVTLNVRKLSLFALLAAFGALPTFASLIRLDFEGSIQASDFGSVSVGTSFSGDVYYDTAAAPFLSFTGSDVTAAAYLIPQAFLLNVGGSTVIPDSSSPDLSGASVIDRDASQPQPLGATDSIIFQLAGFKVSGPLAGDVQTDHGLFLSFMGSPAVLGSVQLPETFPDLGIWNNILPDTSIGLVTNPATDVFLSFRGQFISVRSSAVPEPSYFLVIPFLLALGRWATPRKYVL